MSKIRKIYNRRSVCKLHCVQFTFLKLNVCADYMRPADRGFKNIDAMLSSKGCTLVRPPSVQSGSKLTKDEVRLTKQVASLRIHIERCIRRATREFSFLKAHSCVQHHLIKYLDHCVVISSGISNVQPLLIRSE